MGVSLPNAVVVSYLVEGLDGELRKFVEQLVDELKAPGLEDIYDGLRDAGRLNSH